MHMEGGGGGLSRLFVTGRKRGFAENTDTISLSNKSTPSDTTVHETEAHMLCATLC